MSKSHRKSQAGFTIIENLVAIALVSIALVGSTAMFTATYQSNATTRTYGTLISDVRLLMDSYRSDYGSLLDEFATNYIDITNGQQATVSQSSANARSNYVITFTAIKTKSDSIPEAVRINIAASQRRGKIANGQYSFETIIAQVGT